MTEGSSSLERALELLPEGDAAWRPKLLWVRSLVLRVSNPKVSRDSAIEAASLSEGRSLHAEFMKITEELTPAKAIATYESHLRQIVERCRGWGAATVLMMYPGPTPRIHRSLRRVAVELGVEVVDQAAAFRSRIDAAKLDDHFISDGHCNDAGYAVMASVVGDDIKRRVRPQ